MYDIVEGACKVVISRVKSSQAAVEISTISIEKKFWDTVLICFSRKVPVH